MKFELGNKRVLVVGASSGIGEATAAAFAAAGNRMVAAARAGAKLEDAAGRIGAEAEPLDILDGPGIEAFFARQAPFDHVVITAARTKTGSVASLPMADALAAMESKFWGAYRMAKAARINGGGSLTFVSGQLAVRPCRHRCCRVRSTALFKGWPAAWRWSWRRCGSTPYPPG